MDAAARINQLVETEETGTNMRDEIRQISDQFRARRQVRSRIMVTLCAIALGVCDYLAETTGCPGQLAKLALEGSIIPVVENMFQKGATDRAMAPGTDPELLATTAAWAIFGAARRWYQTPDRIPAEEMAAKIEAMVKPIFLSASPG